MDRLNHFVHPSEEISHPEQLKGREGQLRQLRDCFETNGMNAFIWGLRGVGKTSLVHTALTAFTQNVRLAAAIGCEKDSTFDDLLNDVFRRVVSGGKVDVRDKGLKAKLSAFGFSVEAGLPALKDQIKIRSVNHASDLLNTILPADYDNGREWVIIVDEFDQLKNTETIGSFTALAKQISVDKLPLKLVFCGVASNLNDLIGTHESVDRYLKAIELAPLIDGAILEIVDYVACNFGIEFFPGQRYRVAQIASGYPHFAHVILNEVLRVAYEQGSGQEISQVIFKEAVQNAAKSAATRLQNAYDLATRKGTDRYIEVLWAVADGQHFDKQFKDIFSAYQRIMSVRRGREALEDEQKFRNHLNSLCGASHGSVLLKGKVGWYRFADPMFRSYVRMIAHTNDMDLGEESFRL
ncbi:ATP-binding protein [Paracoccus sp. SJTW-4]|uniref:ATP-binding protein n=1 Tax=Paracoccus sp. SJTW-4 TaxID=3078428 RepID=UPI0039EAEDEA